VAGVQSDDDGGDGRGAVVSLLMSETDARRLAAAPKDAVRLVAVNGGGGR
jgi:hypothetical protein